MYIEDKEYDTDSINDLIKAMTDDSYLLLALFSGSFRFVENHLIYDDKYLIKVENKYILTDYTRFHLDECAVKFVL